MSTRAKILVVAIAIVGCVLAALVVFKPERGLVIATWNLEWFPGRGQKPTVEEVEAHFDAVVEAINKLDADILCVQEIRDVPGSKHLKRLAEETGYEIQTISDFNHLQEVAILSRQPAVASWFERFVKAAPEKNPPRGFAYAHFKIEGYPEIHLYSVHLKSNAGGGPKATAPKREEAARQLVAHAEDVASDGVVIIAGDLNTDPTRPDWEADRTMEILKEAGFLWSGAGVEREDLVSWLSDGRFPDAVFDHILVRGEAEVSNAATLKTGRDVSDHRAVWVATARESTRR